MTNTTGIPHGRTNPTHLEGRFATRPTTKGPYVPSGITIGLTFAGSLPLA